MWRIELVFFPLLWGSPLGLNSIIISIQPKIMVKDWGSSTIPKLFPALTPSNQALLVSYSSTNSARIIGQKQTVLWCISINSLSNRTVYITKIMSEKLHQIIKIINQIFVDHVPVLWIHLIFWGVGRAQYLAFPHRWRMCSSPTKLFIKFFSPPKPDSW